MLNIKINQKNQKNTCHDGGDGDDGVVGAQHAGSQPARRAQLDHNGRKQVLIRLDD